MALEKLSEKFEACVIASGWVKPESRIIDSREIFVIINTTTHYEFMNGVYRTRLGAENAEKEIERHYRFFREHNISFRWYVFPHSTPAELNEKIQQLNPGRIIEMQGLYARTDDPGFRIPSGVTVEELSKKNLADYTETKIAGWSQSGAEADKIRREIRAGVEKGDMGYRGFLARYNGEPASTGMMRIVNGAGYFYGGSTLPEFRGKGAYRGLVAHRLRLLHAQGIELALVLARTATSAPICRTIGFKIACECRTYDFSFYW